MQVLNAERFKYKGWRSTAQIISLVIAKHADENKIYMILSSRKKGKLPST